jgi:integrase/recombinase XerD
LVSRGYSDPAERRRRGERDVVGRDASMTSLADHLSKFLREHLPRERKASPHTCEAYAYAFQLLVCFAASRLKVRPSQLTVEQLDVPPSVPMMMRH